MKQKEFLKKATLWGLRTLDRTYPPLAAHWGESLFLTPEFYPRPEKENQIWKEGRPLKLSSGRAWRVYGQGPRLVFVHGWESRGSSFFLWVEPLVRQGFQVALWDLPAHGDSPGQKTNMVAAARALEHDLGEWDAKERGPLFGLVGHSFGGCTSLFAQLKGRLLPRCTVTIGSPSNVAGVIMNSADRMGFSEKSRELFKVRLEARTGLRLDEGDFRKVGPRVPSRVLVVHDQKDKEVEFPQACELAKAIPGAKLLETEGLGHRRILRDSDVINRVGSFLLEHKHR